MNELKTDDLMMFEELENVEELGNAGDFITGFAVGLGTVGTIVGIYAAVVAIPT